MRNVCQSKLYILVFSGLGKWRVEEEEEEQRKMALESTILSPWKVGMINDSDLQVSTNFLTKIILMVCLRSMMNTVVFL